MSHVGWTNLCWRQNMASSQCTVRWVHSAAMPADGLTKSISSAQGVLMDFLAGGVLAAGARSHIRVAKEAAERLSVTA